MGSADGIGVGIGIVGADSLPIQHSAVQRLRPFGCGMGLGASAVSSFLAAGRLDHPVGLSVTRVRVWGSF
jgi:hypothetical protein